MANKMLSNDIDDNETLLKTYLGNSSDVMFTKFKVKFTDNELDAMLVHIEGLIDEEAKRDNVIKPLIEPPLTKNLNIDLKSVQSRLSVKGIVPESSLKRAVNEILKSHAFLVVDGFAEGLLLSVEGFEIRSIEPPETEQTVRGAKEGFVETTSVNLSLIRRRIKHHSLRFEEVEIGLYSQTKVTLAYVKDIADHNLINRVKDRLHQIKVDSIINSGEIEQLIEDQPYSIFPTIGNTERPDNTAALLMQGRVFVFVDGDPVSLFVPFQFVESVKNVEDYNSRPYYTSFIRLIRFFSFGLSITFPALYMATVNFNKSLVPSDLIVPLTVAREAVPFPLALEVLIVMIMFEIIREAGVRLPKQVGTAVSIVGPLIIGEVAVQSSIIGAPTVIIVSISYIASFVITPIVAVTSLLRLGIFFAASLFGSFGLTVSIVGIITHMVSLSSLGVSYMAPFSPFYIRDWKDAFIRFPTRLLKNRLKSIPNRHSRRVESLPNTEEKK